MNRLPKELQALLKDLAKKAEAFYLKETRGYRNLQYGWPVIDPRTIVVRDRIATVEVRWFSTIDFGTSEPTYIHVDRFTGEARY